MNEDMLFIVFSTLRVVVMSLLFYKHGWSAGLMAFSYALFTAACDSLR